jgi:hypothetical protein
MRPGTQDFLVLAIHLWYCLVTSAPATIDLHAVSPISFAGHEMEYSTLKIYKYAWTGSSGSKQDGRVHINYNFIKIFFQLFLESFATEAFNLKLPY